MAEVKFLSVAQFKAAVGTIGIQVLENKKTGKLFMSTDNGDTYRVQADIDSSKEMKVLVPDTGIEDACLVNVAGGAEMQFSL
jgi:hypothetical protein